MKKTVFFFLLCLLVLPVCSLRAQQGKKDSLVSRLKGKLADTARVNCLNALSRALLKENPADALNYTTAAYALAQKTGYEEGKADAGVNKSEALRLMASYEQSLAELQEAQPIFESLGLAEKVANINIQYAKLYTELRNPQKGREHLDKAMEIYRKLGRKKDEARVYDEIGRLYWGAKEYEKSLGFYRDAIRIKQELKDGRGIAFSYEWIGNDYFYLGNYDSAMKYYSVAEDLARKHKDKSIEAFSIQNIGFVQMNSARFDEAEKRFLQSLAIFEELDDFANVIFTHQAMGSMYAELKQYEKAVEAWENALRLSYETGLRSQTMQTYSYLSQMYSGSGDYKKAYDFQDRYHKLKDSLLSDESQRKIADAGARYEAGIKEAESKAELEKRNIEDRRQENITWAAVIGLVLVTIFAVFMFNRFRITRRQKRIIEEQRGLVETKNKSITDSIYYARRIQRALLASEKLLKKNLHEHFVLYKPKDIVSGDFYWACAAHDGSFLLLCGDCTGHGVPGAFMSLLNISLLNEITVERLLTSPGIILNAQREGIIKALNPEEAEEQSHDGMDCVICRFDYKKSELTFSCANNPLWLIRNGELQEFTADKQPVGLHRGTAVPFSLQQLALQKGDCLYLLTDGYADQFGGPKGKKFKYKMLKKTLLEIHRKPMNEQQALLDEIFENWKGNLEQVDDVLVIGIRI
ncbi:MAG: protein serine/threonine phosphatase [Bacteroidetes bacterium]|nr:MAG: protein serine/threonine phosphatase [Bacteroidota bacterium]